MPHISNLYRPEGQTILLFKRCYCLEKIHGTNTKVVFNPANDEIKFHSGGETHEKFVSLFNQEQLLKGFNELGVPFDKTVTIFSECYGGKQQGMSYTYGKDTKVIAYDVQIGDKWLNVPAAEDVAKKLGIEFVHYVETSTDLAELDARRDAPSIQAKRNGIIEDKLREGVVIRPLVEMTLNNGERVACKHKGDSFQETATSRPVVDPTKMKMLEDSIAIANEWVTPMRLEHVLDKIPNHSMEKMRDIISAMVEDVFREGSGEIVESEAVKKSIGKKTVESYKNYIKSKLYDVQ